MSNLPAFGGCFSVISRLNIPSGVVEPEHGLGDMAKNDTLIVEQLEHMRFEDVEQVLASPSIGLASRKDGELVE